jgi:hypothetical protein
VLLLPVAAAAPSNVIDRVNSYLISSRYYVDSESLLCGHSYPMCYSDWVAAHNIKMLKFMGRVYPQSAIQLPDANIEMHMHAHAVSVR